ncbi:MAG: nuclear transport factor 2 family protein [Limnohabitans sp.]|nr:nuclear transport factor 2 family protein [Limnohabitans sp.]
MTPPHRFRHPSLIWSLFFQNLKDSNVERMADFYTLDASFKDPFNEVQGLKEIERIFSHVFVALVNPRFVVKQTVTQAAHCFLTWDFLFSFRDIHKNQEQCIRGGTHLFFEQSSNAQWKIKVHRDYWDAAEELYEKLPFVGAFMRWLKKRANN